MKKQTRNLLFLALFGGLLFTSCGENQQQDEVEDVAAPMQNEMHQMEEEEIDQLDEATAIAGIEFNDEVVGNIFRNYAELKRALVAAEPDAASDAADQLAEGFIELEIDQDALEAAQAIATTEEINLQRTKFSELTNAVESLVVNNIASGKVYKQYCPMAFEGQGGYWLSATEEVRNPFYGDKMLKCGSVKEVIE